MEIGECFAYNLEYLSCFVLLGEDDGMRAIRGDVAVVDRTHQKGSTVFAGNVDAVDELVGSLRPFVQL